MKTQREIEAAIREGMTRFEREYMGRGPKDIHAHLIGDLLVVRLKGRVDRCRTVPGPFAARRKGKRPAQTVADAAYRSGARRLGSARRRSHWHETVEPAPPHHHFDGRRRVLGARPNHVPAYSETVAKICSTFPKSPGLTKW